MEHEKSRGIAGKLGHTRFGQDGEILVHVIEKSTSFLE